jgi:hypothetical protein
MPATITCPECDGAIIDNRCDCDPVALATKDLEATPLKADRFGNGERVVLSVLEGYVPDQNRPMDCRGNGGYHKVTGEWTFGCKCGECGGRTRLVEGTSKGVTYYMDNSTEATVECDDGETRIARIEYPHGDLC